MALAQRALTLLSDGGYALGPQWEEAHDIAQAHEGDALFDQLHAIVHRIEGDEWNANYWYRRAGLKMPDTSVADEVNALRQNLS
nr:hypothetical protein [Notoacmeibacter sp. MSK16QG-6]